MRRNQITIKIERFGTDAPDGKHQVIEIYADSNNVYEALSEINRLAKECIDRSTKPKNRTLGVSSVNIK